MKSSGKSRGSKMTSAKVPRVLSVVGGVVQISEKVILKDREALSQETEKKIKVGVVFKEQAHLRSSAQSIARIQLSNDHTLIIYPETDIELPSILWQNGKVESIKLNQGSFRLICQTACNIPVKSDLFLEEAAVGDFIYSYSKTIPAMKLEVLKGEASFKGLENEESLMLKEGQSIEFRGQFEQGEIVYDTLLKGRKVARGKLLPIQVIEKNRLDQLIADEKAYLKKEELIKKSQQRKPDQICDRPWGKLNECVFACHKKDSSKLGCNFKSGDQCLRKRCNANGEWADEIVIDGNLDLCSDQEKVAPCNY